MNLFSFLSKLNHPSEKDGWCEVTAYFTGKCEKAAVGKPGRYKEADYNEYEIRYMTEKGEKHGWYTFYPLEDPDPETIKDTEVRILYCKRKPWMFKAI